MRDDLRACSYDTAAPQLSRCFSLFNSALAAPPWWAHYDRSRGRVAIDLNGSYSIRAIKPAK